MLSAREQDRLGRGVSMARVCRPTSQNFRGLLSTALHSKSGDDRRAQVRSKLCQAPNIRPQHVVLFIYRMQALYSNGNYYLVNNSTQVRQQQPLIITVTSHRLATASCSSPHPSPSSIVLGRVHDGIYNRGSTGCTGGRAHPSSLLPRCRKQTSMTPSIANL